ncbi:hypothetical protein SMJ63A_60237 [Stenotrophomonas geniculata]
MKSAGPIAASFSCCSTRSISLERRANSSRPPSRARHVPSSTTLPESPRASSAVLLGGECATARAIAATTDALSWMFIKKFQNYSTQLGRDQRMIKLSGREEGGRTPPPKWTNC